MTLRSPFPSKTFQEGIEIDDATGSLGLKSIPGSGGPAAGNESLDPEILQSGFGVNFLSWSCEIRGEFVSEFLMANFSRKFFGLVFPVFRPPPPPEKQIHAQKSPAFLSRFTFSNPKCFHGDFLLTGETNKS